MTRDDVIEFYCSVGLCTDYMKSYEHLKCDGVP